MTLFYTGKGDKGQSKVGQKEFAKTDLILQTLGELDELNSLIGLARNNLKTKILKLHLLEIQENLFLIQANLANLIYPKFKPPVFSRMKINNLEKEIKKIEERVKPERRFIIPGGENESAWLDYLRSVSRRVERRAAELSQKKKVSVEILSYLNRLSSFFFALARLAAKNKKIKEQSPKYK